MASLPAAKAIPIVDVRWPGYYPRTVSEDVAHYPEQFFFGVGPAPGLYLRPMDGITFKKVSPETRAKDLRPPIFQEALRHTDHGGQSLKSVTAK